MRVKLRCIAALLVAVWVVVTLIYLVPFLLWPQEEQKVVSARVGDNGERLDQLCVRGDVP